MRRRFTLNAEGLLADREGVVLGRLVGITVEVPKDAQNVGDIGGPVFDPEKTEKKNGGVGENKRDEAADVWSHFVEVRNPRSKDLDPETRKLINAALKVATVEECCRAIDGNEASAFHQGQNDRQKRYNRISHILKGKRGSRTTREQIDLFLDIAEKAGVSSPAPDAARVSQAKRAVLDALEFPGDAQVVERGDRAEEWLNANGWRVERFDSEVGLRAEFFRVGV